MTYLSLQTNNANEMSMTTEETDHKLKDEIFKDLHRLLQMNDNPKHTLLTISNVQQDFINSYDSGDMDYLKDGNLILTEIKKILVKIALEKV